MPQRQHRQYGGGAAGEIHGEHRRGAHLLSRHAAGITDLLGGRIEFIITDVAVTREFINNGSLAARSASPRRRSVAVAAGCADHGRRSVCPATTSLPGAGLFAPKNAPADVVQKLNKAFLQVMATDEAKKFFADIGLEPDHQHAGKALPTTFSKQTELWGRIIKESGLEKI